MPRVVGIDHLVLSVGDFARSKAFYGKVLGFLGFKLKHEYPDMAGWSNGKHPSRLGLRPSASG
jgi:catechol 2,3-dioxygenase-like lactoylglutathione lyase family enzyme